MDIMSFINESGMFVVAAAYVLCAIVKQIPKIPNWIIPIVAVFAGVGFGAAMLGVDAQSLIMGGMAGWAAVGINQTVKQSTERTN